MAKKNYTPTQVQSKMEHYCAYQERCHAEVRNKILSYACYGDDLEQIIAHLIKEDFLNEERFAQAYVSGKFRIKKWGKQKIKKALVDKQIGTYLIDKAIAQIDEQDYRDMLKQLLLRKMKQLRSADPYILHQKLFRYAYNKGYETDIIRSVLRTLIEF